MSGQTHPRYPGAQPFADDALSRKTFFGREKEAYRLANQILANRLVVVYAKSGLGKTSLLNAGVAQLLRDAAHLPLPVRVNDVERGPIASVLYGIRAAVERQGVEYVPGRTESLWHFFKTTELWLGDRLLTPVLILDQFEELFTLQGPQTREAFLVELGGLMRGAPPPFIAPDDALSEKPPELRIVLSLREDFLGCLDEAADRIPQILDERFRLRSLTLEAGEEALTCPAAIEDSALETRPFRIDREAVTAILGYLSRRRGTVTASPTIPFVEPFQLQLVCQRIERLAAKRQKVSRAKVTLTFQDIGGEAGLERTIKDFYKRTLEEVPARERRAVKRMCSEYLISPEGRRLSVEQNELCKTVKVEPNTLHRLVALRLLRSDTRADSTYYELSHDTLVHPILGSRLVGALTRAIATWLLALGSIGVVGVLGMLIAPLIKAFWVLYQDQARGTVLVNRWLQSLVDEVSALLFDEIFLLLVALGITVFLALLGWFLVRKSLEAGREFNRARGRIPRSRRNSVTLGVSDRP